MAGLPDVTDFIDARFEKQIRARHAIDSAKGDYAPFPDALHDALKETLEADNISRLYSHQAEAFTSIADGNNTVLVSQTASGKTLSFLLPVLNDYVTSTTPFSVMMLYPTKALSRDQENTLGAVMQTALKSKRLGTFDGDTPREARRSIQRMADFVITNPDMLHAGILPNHNRGWKNFLSRLKYIVVDEVHMYRGDFGSHVSNVFRRLLRVCEMHGSSPQFICSSATVGNPKAHVEALFRRPFQVIQRDGAPRPARDIYFVNPPLVNSLGGARYRKGPGSVSVPLIRKATEAGIRTICFCRARQEVERLVRAITDRHPGLRDRVKPYRGGLLPNERRQLERDLFNGKITTIVSTNALELGIDIGDLDLCILSGHPGTVASFWQQAGRVGRKGSRAVIVYVARDTPVDQYLVHHPEFILRTPIEQAWLNSDNPYIILQHLPCAAYEHPLREEEAEFQGPAYGLALNVLAEEKTVVPYHQTYRYAVSDYPAKGVNLRGMTDYNIEIYRGTEVIGELDPIGARGTLYKDAIYQHLGRRYMSLELDLAKKLCRVEEVHVDYYTEAVWENRIEMIDPEEERDVYGGQLRFGYVHVNKQPKMYKKIRERTFENIGYGPITLDPFEYDTTGLSLLVPQTWKKEMDGHDRRYMGAALYGLSYILRRTAPSLCMADVKDIETDVSLHEEEELRWKSSLYLYDTHEGGVGYAEKVYEKIEDALALCRRILHECECEAGCPACVPPLPPGIDNAELEDLLIESNAAMACTDSLVEMLLEGVIRTPDVQVQRRPVAPAVAAPEEDVEMRKLNTRLSKAARILQKKRERQH